MSFAQPFADYVILSRIGAGAMGTVFKARHKKLNRIVALKVLRPSLGRDTRYVERLRREARIVASLNHPNIVAGYDLGEEGGYHFFVMEYFDGPSLRALLGEWGMFPEEQVLDVAIQVVKALDHAYRRGVIHRDIKPGNILIDRDGRVKLTDMGLAKGPTDLALTRDGATLGTPQYISPEQARDPQGVDIRSDLYSLGATLYHMATGQTPFHGGTMAEVITKLLHERAPSATDLNPKLGAGLSLVIRKLMAKDPALRYQTPRELLDDLLRVEREETPDVDLSSLEAAEPSGRPRRDRRRLLAALAFAAVAAVSIWVGTLASGGGADGAPTPEEFALRLERTVSGTLREQLAALDRAREAAVTRPLLDALAAKEREVIAEVERVMNARLLARLAVEREELGAAIRDPANWRRPPEHFVREFADRLAGELESELGLAASPRGKVLPGMAAVRELVGQLVEERDAGLLLRLEGQLADVAGTCLKLVSEHDFAGAERALRQRVANFFDDSRSGVTREELSGELRTRVEQAIARTRREVRNRIDAEERRVADDLRGKVADQRQQVDAALAAGGSSERLLAQLDEFVLDLREHYPAGEDFRPGADPWPDVDLEIGDLRRRLFAPLQHDRVRERLSLAYHTLAVRGDYRRAGEWLEFEVDREDLRQRVDRHRQVLGAGGSVSRAVLRTLTRAPGRLVVRPVADPSRELTLEVGARADGSFDVKALSPGRREMATSVVDLRFTDLLDQARALDPEVLADIPDADDGLALCLFLSRQTDVAEQHLRTPEAEEFFVEEVWPLLRAALAERSLERVGAGRQALSDLVSAYQRALVDGSSADVRLAYDELRERFPEVLQQQPQVVGDIESWLLRAERRLEIADQLRELHTGGGAGIEVDESLRARVTYPAAALAELPSGEGWSPSGHGLRFELAEVPLSRARQLALAFEPVPAASDRRSSLAARLAFPAHAGAPRLCLLEFDGLAVALALLADDSVAAAVARPEQLRDAGRLQEALQVPLARAAGVAPVPAGIAVPVAVPGAVHELLVHIAPVPFSADRYDVEVRFDGAILFVGRQRIDRGGGAAIVPMHPLEVALVRLGAVFDR